jgi:DNA-binding CsgD family transcriptional regulator
MDYDKYKRKNALTEEDRVISELEEQCLRLCHHDHEGLTQAEAAIQLGCSQQNIADALGRVKLKAPQLFPILTKAEYVVREWLEEGATVAQIAILMGISKNRIYEIIAQLKNKGVHFLKLPKTVQYDPDMDDNQIKEKF